MRGENLEDLGICVWGLTIFHNYGPLDFKLKANRSW